VIVTLKRWASSKIVLPFGPNNSFCCTSLRDTEVEAGIDI
jgi:hypothetical protein